MHTLPLMLVALSLPTQVSSVVVYPDRAEVTRTQTVTCSSRPLAAFEAVPPAADPASFRASVQGATVESLVVEERPRPERYGPELQTLQKRREALETELAELTDARARDEALERLAEGLTQVAVQRVTRELTEPKPDTRMWNAAFDAALDTRLRAVASSAARSVRLREVQRELETLRTREGFLEAAAARLERRVEVRLECPAGTRARVDLRYVVGGAGWVPAYEARADEAAGSVELSTLATVSQSTGEDWGGVALVLSTARPRANANPPELRPLELRAYERRPERKVLVRREEYQEHAEAGGGETSGADSGLRALPQGLSVQLEVPGSSRVPGDGSSVRLRVARTRLKATYSWRAIPKLQPSVFRVARAVNTAPFPLLPGTVEVFRAAGFIGRQELELVPQGAPFQLSFGIEESLRVERQVVDEIQRDTGFLGSHRRFRYAYRFVVENHRDKPETLELSEHVPLSELDDVKVEVEEKATTQGFVLEAADGIATWKLPLKPGEKRSVDLAFHVDVPDSYDMGGL
jgi:uncharacterized protein (TIGR02231 family)